MQQYYGSEARNTTVHWYIPWMATKFMYNGITMGHTQKHGITIVKFQQNLVEPSFIEKKSTVVVPLYDLVLWGWCRDIWLLVYTSSTADFESYR